MLEGIWENWSRNALLLELWNDTTILESSLELCPKDYKNDNLWPSSITTRYVFQGFFLIKWIYLYKNISSISKELEVEAIFMNWGMAEQ